MTKLLSDAFALYRRHFRLIAAVTFTIWLPWDLVQSYLDYHVIADDDYWTSWKLTTFGESVVGILASGGVLSALEAGAVGGEVTYAGTLRGGLKNWARIWWANFLFGLGLLLGLVLLIVPALILAVRCAVLEPVVVRNQVTGMTAIRRSFALTKGKGWRVLGWFLVAFILTTLATFGLWYFRAMAWPEEWILDAATSAACSILLMYLTVFGWVVMNHLQSTHVEENPEATMETPPYY